MRKQHDNNINDIVEYYEDFIDLLIDRFFSDLDGELLNETNCTRAKAKISYCDGKPTIEEISCTKDMNDCNMCAFWNSNSHLIKEKSTAMMEPKVQPIINRIINGDNNIKGDACRTLGDTIIAIESKSLEDCYICTINKKHFEPICNIIDANIIIPK